MLLQYPISRDWDILTTGRFVPFLSVSLLVVPFCPCVSLFCRYTTTSVPNLTR